MIDARIEGTNYYILSVDIKPGNNISVELESTDAVSIEDCVEISRAIEHNLDRDEEDFSLKVTSPGLDKPLRDYRQYVKNIGRKLKVKLMDDRDIEGDLKAADTEKITLYTRRKERVEGKKKKILVEEDLELPYTDIKEAKVKIQFK